VRNLYDKVADKIRSDGVKDVSVNTVAKAAQYSLDLQSVFESKRVNPVVKKHFDPAFKRSTKRSTVCELSTAVMTHVARMFAEDAGRAAALDVSKAVARQTNADADTTRPWTVLSPQIEVRSYVLHVTVLIITQ